MNIFGSRGMFVLAVSAALCFAGCGGSSSSNSTPSTPGISGVHSAYVANAGSGNISEYAISSGILHEITGSPFSISANATALAMTPDGNFLYALDPVKNLIVELSINSTSGVLTQVGTLTTTSTPTSMAIDPKGKFLYAGNTAANSISVFAIGTDGKLTETSYSPVIVNGPVHSVAVSAKGTYLFASVPTMGNIYQFSLDATTGTPTIHAGSPFPIGANPIYIAVSSDETFAIVIDQSGLINRLQIDPTSGSLTLGGFSPFTANATPIQVIIDSTGSYTYFLSNTGRVITTIAGHSNGSPYQLTTTLLGKSPAAMAISGGYIYAVNSGDNTVSEFSLSAGSTTAISPTTVTTGTTPMAIAVR